MLAIIQFTTWISSLIGEMVRASRGDSPLDTNQEIVMAYLIVMSFPEAFLSLGTIILASLSDDVSPSGGDRHNSSERDKPIGHLPEIEETDDDVTTEIKPDSASSLLATI